MTSAPTSPPIAPPHVQELEEERSKAYTLWWEVECTRGTLWAACNRICTGDNLLKDIIALAFAADTAISSKALRHRLRDVIFRCAALDALRVLGFADGGLGLISWAQGFETGGQ